MRRLRVVHQTGFRYDGEVSASYNEARMLPATGGHQFVLSSQLDISPKAHVYSYQDYWGTRVSAFEVLTPHQELSLTATSLVEVQERQFGLQLLDWEGIARAAVSQVTLVEKLDTTALTAVPDEVVELARSISSGKTPAQAAEAICLEIGDRMEYVPGSTTVHSTATDAWLNRKGVCQDISHVCLGALRSVGIPARYASGYLHPDDDAEIGQPVTGESHAWVEWFTGEWNGFDPTNSRPIGGKHVVVGRGRDYADVPPLRGVYAGPYASELFVSVTVTLEA
ncbi:MAG TPA: transglutaminase family protein [Pseudoclavibacter sp.]|nr:transglutaminase family protein [Pseudoclavibacter sp.]